MKLVLILGVGILLINVLAFLILSGYNAFNFVLVCISTISTTGLVLAIVASESPDAFKISMPALLSVSFLGKTLLSLISKPVFQDNYVLLLLAAVLVVETLMTLFIRSRRA